METDLQHRIDVMYSDKRIDAHFSGSTRNPVRSCRLQFDGVGEKRTGDCFRAGKHNRSDANDSTRQLPLTARQPTPWDHRAPTCDDAEAPLC
jgi:hypothetical protein